MLAAPLPESLPNGYIVNEEDSDYLEIMQVIMHSEHVVCHVVLPYGLATAMDAEEGRPANHFQLEVRGRFLLRSTLNLAFLAYLKVLGIMVRKRNVNCQIKYL